MLLPTVGSDNLCYMLSSLRVVTSLKHPAMFCPLVTHTILKFCPILAINLSKVSKALFYSVSHSFDCNDLTEEQWVILSKTPGLADHALKISRLPLMDIPNVNEPINHYPQLYEFIALKNSRGEYPEEMKGKVSSFIENALYDDIDMVPARVIRYLSLHHDCSHQLYMLSTGGVEYERACNLGYNKTALITHLFRTKSAFLPVDNMIISPEAERIYGMGYTSMFKNGYVTISEDEYDRDIRVAMRNVINLGLRLTGKSGRVLRLSECMRLIPIVSSPEDPYIPLYLKFLDHCCDMAINQGDIVQFCRSRKDHWFWIHALRQREQFKHSVQQIAQQSLSNPIRYPSVEAIRFINPNIPDDYNLLHMRFSDIPSEDSDLITITTAKVLIHRYYGDTGEDILKLLYDEIIEVSTAKIYQTITHMIRGKVLRKTTASSKSVDHFIDEMICPHLSKIRTVLHSLLSQ